MTATARHIADGRGSVWRRWDPHVHLPGTLMNDQFKDLSVEDALNSLAERSPTIEVIGVTDYFTTASFRRAAEALERGAAPSILFAFPNVELRLDNATSSNHGVNVHLICPPDEVDHLDHFIGGLEFSWAENRYRADEDGLARLGRDFSQDPELPKDAALAVGVNQFKVNFEDLRRLLRTDGWAKGNVLVAVAGGERDGSSGIRSEDGSFVSRRQSIEALADIIFSANPKQSQFWSGELTVSQQELDRIYGGVKLCLHGSDAHDEEKLGAPSQDRFCWLNGDPTFDTLRLACLSPGTRGHIGSERPQGVDSHGRVTSLHMSNSDWFVNETVPINPGLVAIIGAKGSGKTALADLVAAGAGATEPFDNDASFVRRAGQLIEDSVAAVEWSQGEVTLCDFSNHHAPETFIRPVRYLSQQFVDRLCAADGVSDELLAEIERVIFDAWPVDQRQGATSFRDLLQIRLTAARERQSAELRAILEVSDDITAMRQRARAVKSKQAEVDAQRARLAGLEEKIKDLTKGADKKSAARLAAVDAALQAQQEVAQKLDLQRTALCGLRSSIESDRSTTFPRHLERLKGQFGAAGLSEVDWESFEVVFAGQVDEIVANGIADVDVMLETLKGDDPSSAGSNTLDSVDASQLSQLPIGALAADSNRLRELVGLDAARSKHLQSLTESAGEARARIDSLNLEIAKAQGEATGVLVERRLRHYQAYFEALLAEESELTELYKPLEKVLEGFGASVAKLRFAVKRVVDLDQWAVHGESLLDLRKEGEFRGEGELKRIAQSELFNAWEQGDSESAAAAIGDFVTAHSEDLRKRQLLRRPDEESAAEWEREISRWLYRTDHISLRYSLEYDGLSIERLSPGSRGIVLLLLYLAVDQEESDPLIIDQPEENLDPESVYSELVRLFRSASARRQIIMVTHNANLVVNTDVDQVIVAACGPLAEDRLPDLSYLSGGLEDPRIRRSVCEVLEGGAEAFRQRAKRLGLRLDVDEGAE